VPRKKGHNQHNLNNSFVLLHLKSVTVSTGRHLWQHFIGIAQFMCAKPCGIIQHKTSIRTIEPLRVQTHVLQHMPQTLIAELERLSFVAMPYSATHLGKVSAPAMFEGSLGTRCF
jgi:hypothetical protein